MNLKKRFIGGFETHQVTPQVDLCIAIQDKVK